MKKILQKTMVAVLAILMVFSATAGALAAEPATGSSEIYDNTGTYLSQAADTSGLIVGSTGGEWIVIGLARAGRMTDAQKEAYYETAAAHVASKANEMEQLHRNKSTENSRVILALTAIGRDVTDVGGHNLLVGLTDLNYLERQGLNGPVWALIALDAGGYEIPAMPAGGTTQVTRENLIDYILGKQQKNGMWSLTGTADDADPLVDPDITGMTIQALAPYYSTRPDVKQAVDRALTALSETQLEDGSCVSARYAGGIVSNVESTAQVLVALTALGIDPHTDARFVKNGKSIVDAVCSFAVDGGGFCHVKDGALNGMATEQGYYALVSYFRFLNGQSSLYDMKDVLTPSQPSVPGGNTGSGSSGSAGSGSGNSGGTGSGSGGSAGLGGFGGFGGTSTPPTPADPLTSPKNTATAAVETAAKAESYESDEQAQVDAIVKKAQEDIAKATTQAEIDAILAQAQEEIDAIDTAEEKAEIRAFEGVKQGAIKSSSRQTKLNGKRAVKITWNVPKDLDADGYEIFRSTKKSSGYTTKPFFTTTKTSYTNSKSLKTGKTYYYKIRAYKVVNGRKVYTGYSTKAWRKIR